MIDSIKIKIQQVPSVKLEWAGSFPDKSNSEEQAQSNKYKLFNNKNSHYLSVMVKPDKNKTVIIGSIRKWYLGKNTFRDLEHREFKAAIELIAKKLGFSIKKLFNSKVTRFPAS